MRHQLHSYQDASNNRVRGAYLVRGCPLKLVQRNLEVGLAVVLGRRELAIVRFAPESQVRTGLAAGGSSHERTRLC